MKFFLLINIKMPTIVGILIFISRKNFMLSSALQEKILNWWYLIFHKRNKFHSQLSWAWKKIYNLGASMGADLSLYWSSRSFWLCPELGLHSNISIPTCCQWGACSQDAWQTSPAANTSGIEDSILEFTLIQPSFDSSNYNRKQGTSSTNTM